MACLHRLAKPSTRSWSAQEYADLCGQDTTLLATHDHGFAIGRLLLDEAELLLIATHPDHRRAGIARACLTSYESQAVNRGALTSLLEVAAGNRPALALYRAFGYVPKGRRAKYYLHADGTREDALLLAKNLTNR